MITALEADALGALYLGGVCAIMPPSSSRLDCADHALRTFAPMIGGGPAPYCITGF